jgi:hypothetical protein
MTRQELEGALNLTDWTKVYDIKDVDAKYITAGIVSALDIVAPEKEIRVKKGPNLYLTRERLKAMKKRYAATGKRYHGLQNEVSRLVRRNKQVMETHVKENLEDHLRKVKGPPGSQYGFRPKRSCTSALAHA